MGVESQRPGRRLIGAENILAHANVRIGGGVISKTYRQTRGNNIRS